MKFALATIIVAFLLLRRVKRSVGFQKFNETTLIIRIVLFALVAIFILLTAIINPTTLIPGSIGIALGLILAYIATNHAQFEKKENALYFKTHVWIEVLVIALFLARFAYRIIILKDAFQPGQTPQDMQTRMQSMRDPLTSSVFFIFCTYYIGYFSFILKEGKKAIRNDEL